MDRWRCEKQKSHWQTITNNKSISRRTSLLRMFISWCSPVPRAHSLHSIPLSLNLAAPRSFLTSWSSLSTVHKIKRKKAQQQHTMQKPNMTVWIQICRSHVYATLARHQTRDRHSIRTAHLQQGRTYLNSQNLNSQISTHHNRKSWMNVPKTASKISTKKSNHPSRPFHSLTSHESTFSFARPSFQTEV